MRRCVVVSLLALTMVAAGMVPATITPAVAANSNPEWYLPQNHVSAAGEVLAGVLSGQLRQPSPVNAGTPCPAEPSPTGNVQVSCLAEDDASPQNTQSETTVVAVGKKVVVGFNDSLVCCVPAINLSGYSVSTDGGKSFTAMGNLTWTFYAHSFVQGPVMLSDSTDGVHWRTTQISAPDTCAPTTPGSHPVPAGGTVYVTWEQFDLAACTTNPDVTSGTQFVAAVDVASATVTRITSVARVQGAGDVLRFCGFANLGVIETAPGHDSRQFEAPSSTLDANGTLYLAWNDRPAGTGGGFDNATRIFLSYSTDGAKTFSPPQVISGPVSAAFMSDRYQPAIVADASGLHAMWYERVQSPSGGPDLLRTDKEDLTLATPTAAPVGSGEVALSTVPFPIYQTNPNQDPVIAACYMGDYNQIASNGSRRLVSWGDNRNVVTTAAGITENQADVFLQKY